jgi:hypothetical protein
MKRARVRLAITAALFFAWIGYLVYLAATTTRPIVLSRPQFLAANLYVIADLRDRADGPDPTLLTEISGWFSTAPQAGLPAAVPWRQVGLAGILWDEGPSEVVTVRQVVWAEPGAAPTPDRIVVRGLRASGPKFGWVGPGEYVLALSKRRGRYELTPLQRTPGFWGPAPDGRTLLVPSRIYHATPQVKRQLDEIKAEYHPE